MVTLKQAAQAVVRAAVYKGELWRSDRCEKCGVVASRGLQGHHFDYEKPFDVVWLCGHCHNRVHYLMDHAWDWLYEQKVPHEQKMTEYMTEYDERVLGYLW